uniref:Uncharacterized protein n=1 Tax=Caenorhabditis japonica TaxID=281687 RepID=A0A8R1EPT4_CAEJA
MDNRKRSAGDSGELSYPDEAKKPKETVKELYNTLVAYGCRKGERADMQDTHILEPKFDVDENRTFLFGFCNVDESVENHVHRVVQRN